MTMNKCVTVSITPWLSVRDGARAVEFYKSALGADEVYHVGDPGGAIVSRLSIGGAEFWVADESPEHGNFSPDLLGGGSVKMILIVPDPDSTFAKAVAAGAREVYPVQEEHGWPWAAWSIHSAITGRSGAPSHRRQWIRGWPSCTAPRTCWSGLMSLRPIHCQTCHQRTALKRGCCTRCITRHRKSRGCRQDDVGRAGAVGPGFAGAGQGAAWRPPMGQITSRKAK